MDAEDAGHGGAVLAGMDQGDGAAAAALQFFCFADGSCHTLFYASACQGSVPDAVVSSPDCAPSTNQDPL